MTYDREDHLRRLEIAKQRNLQISATYFNRQLLFPLTALVGAVAAFVASGK